MGGSAIVGQSRQKTGKRNADERNGLIILEKGMFSTGGEGNGGGARRWDRQEAYRLHYERGVPMTEIARQMGVSVSSISRGLKKMRQAATARLAGDPAEAGRVLLSLEAVGRELAEVKRINDEILTELRGPALEERITAAAELVLSGEPSAEDRQRLAGLVKAIQAGYVQALKALEVKIKTVHEAKGLFELVLIADEIRDFQEAVINVCARRGISRRELAEEIDNLRRASGRAYN